MDESTGTMGRTLALMTPPVILRRGFAVVVVALAGILAGSLMSRPAQAADTGVLAAVDRTTVPIDGQVVYTITVSGGMRQLPNPQLPALDADWTVYSGGTSRNFSFVNGQVSSSATFRYVLTPRRPGNLTIGKATVAIGKTVYQTEPVQITVGGAAGGGSQRAAPGRASSGTATDTGDQTGQDLFVTASIDKKNPYVQEQITLTFRFYQRVTLLESPGFTKPTTTGFWAEDLPPQRTLTEIVEGRRYHVTEIQTALFATSAGKYTIGPAILECVVPQVQRVLDNDPFSMFGRSMFGSQKVTLRSKEITVTVKPLPEGAPPEFAGAVGDFRLATAVDRATAAQGDPVTLTVTVTGSGNIKTLPDPVLPTMPEFKAYDSSSSSDINTTGEKVRGSRTSQIVLVPLKAGATSIPPITLAWFDPKSATYKTDRTEAIPLTITPGAVTAGGALGGGGRGAIEVVGQDVRFLRTELSDVTSVHQRPWESPLFWLFQILPVGVMIGAVVHERRRRRLDGDIGFARQIRSGREATRRLKKARLLAARGDDGLFAELSQAVTGYAADRLNRSAAGLLQEDLRSLLAARGVKPDLIEGLTRFLESCDMARFAPAAAGVADRQRLLGEAAALIENLKRGGL
ncbi:MAG: BatD family protein [Candidatus Eisenbacteria bacterium]|nr:BatD family protein [Candidatus Eisenbacteria bacterium]